MRNSHELSMALLTARDALQPFFPGLTWKHIRAGVYWAFTQDPATLDDPPKAEPGKLLTIQEAGSRLGFKRRKIEYLIASGELRAVRIAKRAVRIPESEVTAFAIGRRDPVNEALWRQLGSVPNVADAQVCGAGADPCGSNAAVANGTVVVQATIVAGGDV